jgi:hypothetical protein
MSTAVRSLLATFDALSEAEQQEAAAELLKRTAHLDYGPLPDEALVELAEQSFLEHDAREAEDAKS